MRQYSGKVMTQIRQNIHDYFDADALANLFFKKVFNPKTAQGFGLDIWGRIVARSRFLKIEADTENFGFTEGNANDDWYPFDDGVFYDRGGATKNFRLDDEVYRLLIMMKAYTNISRTTIPSINNVLSQIFADKGKVYVVDLGNMSIRIVFDFMPTAWERAVIESDVIPHPAGVMVEYQYLNADNNFGFEGSGFQPFNTKPFYSESTQTIEDE